MRFIRSIPRIWILLIRCLSVKTYLFYSAVDMTGISANKATTMNLKHLLIAAGWWTLALHTPHTVPSGCDNCGVTLSDLVTVAPVAFPTREACEAAAKRWKANNLKDAARKKEVIVIAGRAECFSSR
jgi:hypothetical protein